MLTQARLKEVLHYDPETGAFTWLQCPPGRARVGAQAAVNVDTNGYRRVQVEGVRYRAHRLAWLYVTGRFPAEEIDHINRDPSDNRIANLREVTRKQNNENKKYRRKENLPRGVYRWGSKFEAAIRHSSQFIRLGVYETPNDAAHVYEAARRLLFTPV